MDKDEKRFGCCDYVTRQTISDLPATCSRKIRNFLPTRAICILTLALCMSGGFQQGTVALAILLVAVVGYIASVLNQPYVYIEQFINETMKERFGEAPSEDALNIIWSALNIMFPIASIVGQFLAAWLCKKLGRKGTALLSCLLYLPGTILSTISYPVRSFEMLFIGRILWSLSNGINAVNATVWIVECAPVKIRGGMAAMQEFSMAIGSLVCQSIGVPFSTEDMWMYTFLPNLPVVLLSIILFYFVPDSPQCILEREKDEDKARRSLATYYGVTVDNPIIEEELAQTIKKTMKTETSQPNEKSENSGILWIFNPCGKLENKMKVVQQAAWLGVMVKIAYVFTGARCLRSYSTFVLHALSGYSLEDANLESWIISLLRIPATLIPVFFVDKLGRRPLIIVSLIITIITLCVMIAAILIGDSLQLASLISFAVLLLINAAGLGSVSRFYAAELVPRSLLLQAVSILSGLEAHPELILFSVLATQSGKQRKRESIGRADIFILARAFTKIVVEFAFFPVANVIGVYSFFLFVVPSIIFLIMSWFMCPETSGRSVYQVLNDIAMRKKLDVDFTPKS